MNIDKEIEIVKNYLKDSAINKDYGDFFKTGGWEVVNLEIPKAMKNVLSELKETKETLKCTQDSWYKDTQELEIYKKIAEKLAHYIWQYDCCEYEIGKNGKCKCYYTDEDCTEKCIIDWARKEVEK